MSYSEETIIGNSIYQIIPYHFELNPRGQESHNACLFTIKLNVKFTLAIDDEESYLLDDDVENPYVVVQCVGRISYDTLMNNNDTQTQVTIQDMLVAIQDMLVEVILPPLSFLADEVIDCSREMMNNIDYYNSNEEVGVDVHIIIYVDELPQLYLDDNDEYDINDLPICFVAASEESIKKLEKVEVKDNPIFCSICLEDVLIGLEATKLPCTHAYHGECIVEWLQISKFCPNCRVEII
ncbi:hypothetical protein CsatB_027998 [Cannabis sativa]